MPYNSIFKSDLFERQVHLVTGGGSGIGRCIAHELAALGAHVVIAGRKAEKLDAVAAEIEEDGGRVSRHVLDIRVEDDVKRVVGDILAETGGVHGLVNNAGGQFPSPMAGINAKGFETVVRTNLTGGFLVARELFNQHMNKRGGAIVNIIADMWGGMPGMAHSGAARAGMLNLTQTAAVEWAAAGVRVNAVAPGWVASSGLDTYTDPVIKSLIPRLKDSVPLKRLATEAEVSSGVCFLLSPGAAFISGACLRIDGGASCNSRVYPLPEHHNSKPYNGFHRYQAPASLVGGSD
jgi:citronellol/citronellal dehydrogenase